MIGKGVCFDSGGLDIKPLVGMLLMKKDMGGAAHALALARLVMASGLQVRLHLLVPAVENAVSGNAFRPGDVLRSRAGISVEIGNTDAEGRLILGDALTRAGEATDAPDLILDFATLTGAARAALGPDLPALFARRDETAQALLAAGEAHDDPCWRLPLHDGYREYLKSRHRRPQQCHTNGFAGASVAALFLDRFVPEGTDWAHFDTYAWRPAAKPGRPKGGDALGLRAAWHMLHSAMAEGCRNLPGWPSLSAPLFSSGITGIVGNRSGSRGSCAVRDDRPGRDAPRPGTCPCAAIWRISASPGAISCRIMPCRCRMRVKAPARTLAQGRQARRRGGRPARRGRGVQRARYRRRLGLGPGRRGRLRRLCADDGARLANVRA